MNDTSHDEIVTNCILHKCCIHFYTGLLDRDLLSPGHDSHVPVCDLKQLHYYRQGPTCGPKKKNNGQLL